MFSRNILFLDLGSSSLKGMVINEKKFTILAKHTQEDSGISNGYISNAVIFQDALCKLIKTLEKKIKGQINATILLVGGNIVKYKTITSNPIKIGNIIEKDTLNKIDLQIKNWVDQNKSLLISSTPIEYKIDNIQTENPIGMYADFLQFKYQVAYSAMNQLGNLAHILEKHGLNIIDIVPSIYCAAALHLSEDEKTLGALIFDIGANKIDWAFFNKNKPISASTIIFNHQMITYKIARSLKISINEAEKLKHNHASSILCAENFCTWAEFIKDDNAEFVLESEIIRKILPEIEILNMEIQKIISNFISNSSIAMLCGNGAWLNKLTEMIQKNTTMTIKLSPGAQPEFDALNGALIHYQNEYRAKEKNILQKATIWLRENL